MNNNGRNYDLIVIGGGAAGLIAAGTALKNGETVAVFDKNNRPARKVMITGKGRCNLTNNTDVQGVIENIAVNPRFMYSTLNRFSPEDTMSLFESLGVPLKTERGGRVFPVSDKAADIVDALSEYSKGADYIWSLVQKILIENKNVQGIETADRTIYNAKRVILATGGKSYPSTGSTGDGYKMAEKTGHTVIPPQPSLVPLISGDSCCARMMGLSLKNVGVKVMDNLEKTDVYTDFGEMLFTHFGLSGPLILSASAHMRPMQKGRFTVVIDMKPALNIEQLDSRLQRDFSKNLNRDFANSLSALLPKKFIPEAVRRSGIPPEQKVNQITREQRQNLIGIIKSFKINISGFRSIDEAIITSGGVSTKEINPKTMESKLITGLYFAGEIIDVDAYTGGFNLQIAFSTGYAAGLHI